MQINSKIKIRVEQIQKYLPSKSLILDLGCGDGLLGITLARLGYRVILVDKFSTKDGSKNLNIIIKTREAENLQGNIEVIQGDYTDKNIIKKILSKKYDGVISFASLDHLQKDLWKVVLEQISKATNSNGIHFISMHNKNSVFTQSIAPNELIDYYSLNKEYTLLNSGQRDDGRSLGILEFIIARKN